MPSSQKNNIPSGKVVVVGGGFGGVYVVKHLLKQGIDVTLISETNFFVYTPLLAEVATGNLSTKDVTFEYSSFFRNSKFTFVRGRVSKVDSEKNVVLVDEKIVPYKWLVMATGARTNFFCTEGREHALTLKSIQDAESIKKRILAGAQSVERDVNVTIIGGGPTGVELAGEMQQFLTTIEKYNKGIVCHVCLIEAGDTLISMFPEGSQRYAKSKLESVGVSVYTGEVVKKITPTEIHTDKHIYPSDVVVWTAGVKPNTDSFPEKFLNERRDIKVDKTLKVVGLDNVYALGDIIAMGEERVPKLAQTAVDEALIVSENIISRIQGRSGNKIYKVVLQGKLISVGKWSGAGEIFGMEMKGVHMWFMWRAVYFFKNPGFRNKFETAFSWFINMFTGRDLQE